MRSVIKKPSIKKSISSRTTGQMTRTVRKISDPTYGKKGTGYIKDPKKATYNALYNKTSYGVKDATTSGSYKGSAGSQHQSYKPSGTLYITNDNIADVVREHPQVIGIIRSNYINRIIWGITLLIIAITCIATSFLRIFGYILICISLYLFYKGIQYRNAYLDAKNNR